ncbi:ParB-like chromosome segregation protein Spo0J [Variovorax sp. OAS795]
MNTVDPPEVSTFEATMPAQNMVLVPLSRLRARPSKRNVRRKARTSIAALAASIRRLGLLQNLTVIPFGDDGDFEVVAGGRRLAALKLLAKKRQHEFLCVYHFHR